MKKVFVLVAIFAVLANESFAEGKPNTKAGDKALLFTITGFGTFGINGLTTHGIPANYYAANDPANASLQPGIGMKYYISNNLALRGAFNIGISSQTTKQPPQNNQTFTDDKVSAFSIGFTPGIQLHITHAGPVTAYVGGELAFGIVSSTHTQPAVTGQTPDETKRNFTQFGAGGFLGIEFYPWDNISFGAEYKLGFLVMSGKQDQTRTVNNATTTTTIDAPSILNLGISSFAVTLGINF